MKPGPVIIRKCGVCKKEVAQRTTMSGNTLGAHFWTDGKMEAPMFPDRPWLVKCGWCGSLIWINEQERMGQIKLWDDPAWSEKINKLGFTSGDLKFSEYLSAAKKTKVQEKEKYLRIRAWWAGNDKRRHTKEKEPLSVRERANMERLLNLLEEWDEDDKIMKAEIMRELGRFEEASLLLKLMYPRGVGVCKAVRVMRKMIKLKNAFVQRCPC